MYAVAQKLTKIWLIQCSTEKSVENLVSALAAIISEPYLMTLKSYLLLQFFCYRTQTFHVCSKAYCLGLVELGIFDFFTCNNFKVHYILKISNFLGFSIYIHIIFKIKIVMEKNQKFRALQVLDNMPWNKHEKFEPCSKKTVGGDRFWKIYKNLGKIWVHRKICDFFLQNFFFFEI